MWHSDKKADIEDLRKELKDDCYGLAFGAGFPEALMEIGDIDEATDDEIIQMAKRNGIIR